MTGAIKIFIIDDNVMIRYALARLLDQEDDMRVVGESAANSELPNHIKTTKPDILIFDIPIPRESGIKDLASLKKFRIPAIVFTKTDQAISKDLIKLLEVGAVGFVTKPVSDTNIAEVRGTLVHEIRKHVKPKSIQAKSLINSVKLTQPPKVIAIGSSTGGPEALVEVLSKIPANFPAGIVIVQHMPAGFTKKFSQRLNACSGLDIKEAEEGDLVKAGRALVAPGDFHMIFTQHLQGKFAVGKVKLTKDPAQWGLRPTVDSMMTSITQVYGRHVIGVILTGMGQDGVIGMKAIKSAGGKTLVQDKHSSVVFGMAQEVIKNNLADEVHPLSKIAVRLEEMV